MAKLLLTPLGLGRGVGGVRARQSICASRPVHCRPRGCVGRTPLRSGRQSLTTLAQLPGDRGDEHRRALGTTEDLVKQLEAPASQERVEGLAKAPVSCGPVVQRISAGDPIFTLCVEAYCARVFQCPGTACTPLYALL